MMTLALVLISINSTGARVRCLSQLLRFCHDQTCFSAKATKSELFCLSKTDFFPFWRNLELKIGREFQLFCVCRSRSILIIQLHLLDTQVSTNVSPTIIVNLVSIFCFCIWELLKHFQLTLTNCLGLNQYEVFLCMIRWFI